MCLSVVVLECLFLKNFVHAGHLQPSCRRSLFTLAIFMIIFSSKVYSIIPLVSRAKAVLTNETVGVTVFLGSVFRLAFMYFTDLTIKDLNFYLNFLNVNFWYLLYFIDAMYLSMLWRKKSIVKWLSRMKLFFLFWWQSHMKLESCKRRYYHVLLIFRLLWLCIRLIHICGWLMIAS